MRQGRTALLSRYEIGRSRFGATLVPTLSVVFDLDGTLIDSKPGIVRCLRHVSESYGLDLSGIDDLVIGPPAEITISRLMPNHSAEARGQFLKTFRQCYARDGWSDCSLYRGITELLDRLKEGGTRIFVCTSKREDFTLRLVDYFNLRSYIEAIAADREDLPSHEKTDLLSDLIQTHAIDRSHGFMVGDSKYDMDAARATGMKAIGVLYGYGRNEDIIASRPDALCATAESILQFLESTGAIGK
jgi:phosphoglycolate phosphatase